MSDLRDLYQEVILDHNRRPRNFGHLPRPDRAAVGHNPLCGDRLTVTIAMDGDRVRDIRFEGQGCAISTASASLMTESVKGRTRSEVEDLFRRFHEVVTGKVPPDEDLGALAAFAGVREFPVRVKCATLSWHTVKAALENRDVPVTTEQP
jgi:nitrogen fixation NifU-like protein